MLPLAHHDTVWPAGTLAEWPFTVTDDGRVSAPGGFDMKCRLVQAVWALRLLCERNLARATVRLLVNGDEEIGSPSPGSPSPGRTSSGSVSRWRPRWCASRRRGRRETGGGPEGNPKTAVGKGVGLFEVAVEGSRHTRAPTRTAARAPCTPWPNWSPRSRSWAHMTTARRSTSVLSAAVRGATSSPDMPAAVSTCVSPTPPRRSASTPNRPPHGLRPPGTGVRLGGWNRPAMAPTPPSQLLFEQAQSVAVQLGPAIRETGVGGVGDGNFVSALRRPVLDALGSWAGVRTPATSMCCRPTFRPVRRCSRGCSRPTRNSRTLTYAGGVVGSSERGLR